MIDIEVKINPSFRRKLDSNIIKECEAITIHDTTLEAESRCKKTCPYDTGALMRSHSSTITDEQGEVKAGVKYAVYVIFGTSRMAARNYPQLVANSLVSENYMGRKFKTELHKKGLLD